MATLNTTPGRGLNFFVGVQTNRAETGREYSSGGRAHAGFTTIRSNPDDPRGATYQVTSLEIGGRSDHIVDAMLGDEATPQYVDECNEYEAQFAKPEGFVHAAAERRLSDERAAARKLANDAADEAAKARLEAKLAELDAEATA